MWDDETRERQLRLLELIGLAQVDDEALDVAALARELDVSEATVRIDLDEVRALGLAFDGLEEGFPPILRTAGRQFLTRRGRVDRDVTRFLAAVVDDLNAREALLSAGTLLVDEFRAEILDGDGVHFARELVPSAFELAVDERLALDLFAAAVALVARLSADAPAGCVAEEIIAVGLMQEARAWLELRREEGRFDRHEEQAASQELHGLFELFEDDDVLDMFEMGEPADAALAEHDPIHQQLGVADQRVDAWFAAFSWTAPTGYLAERRGDDEVP